MVKKAVESWVIDWLVEVAMARRTVEGTAFTLSLAMLVINEVKTCFFVQAKRWERYKKLSKEAENWKFNKKTGLAPGEPP